jgi:Ca2+-binding EF-hand superfamily protein
LNAYHELLDINNDGVVTIEDMRELTKRFSKVNNMTEEQSLMFSKIIEVRQINSTTIKKYIKKEVIRFKIINKFVCFIIEPMVQTLGVY